MTQHTNRFLGSPASITGRPEAYIRVGETMVACTWEEFVASANQREKRAGEWVTQYTTDDPPKRKLAWIEQKGSEGWNRERSRQAKGIGAFVTDYGRAK